MNCKPGDLAVIVGGPMTTEMIGRVVTIVRPCFPGEVVCGVMYDCGPFFGWVVEAASPLPVRMPEGQLYFVKQRVVRDKLLRPIRDNDGEDETLTWAGKPEKVTA